MTIDYNFSNTETKFDTERELRN